MNTVSEYLQQARSLGQEGFLEQYAQPVLIRRTDEQSLAPREEYGSTLRMRIDRKTKEFRVEAPPPRPMDAVFAVGKSERNSFNSKVLVGRTETNDLVVTHLTVSKHHAYFSNFSGQETVQVTDTDSTNGTQVNGQDLPARLARSLQDGDQVAFGDAQFVFYTAAGFYDLLLSLSALR